MAQRKVTYRAELAGGKQVEVGFEKIGESGYKAYERIDRGHKSAQRSADAFERAIEAEVRSFRALKASVDPAFASQLRFERAQNQVNRAVRLGVVSQKEAATVLKQLEARSRGAAAAMELVDSAGIGASHGMRNALLQVNQIGQQVAAGGNLMSAIAIQIPDILGGLGGIAPLILGAAVGLGSAFIPKLFEAKQKAEDLRGTLDQAFSSAGTALDEMREAQDRYTTAIRLSGEVQAIITPQILESLAMEARAREALARLEMAQLEAKKMRFEESIHQARAELDAMIANATATIVADPNDAFINSQADRSRTAAVREVLERNRELVLSLREQQAELDLINALLSQNWGEAAKMVDELAKAAAEGNKTASAVGSIDFSTSIKGAATLASELDISLHKALQIKGLVGAAAQARRDGARPVVFDPKDPNYDPIAAEMERLKTEFGTVSPFAPSRIPSVSRSRGRGGGGGASRETNRLDQEAERIRRSTTTALERYNQEMALTQKLLETGKLTQEQYNRHVAATKEAYDKASASNQQFSRYVSAGRDAVINTIMGQKNAFDQLKRAIARAAVEYALYRTIAGQPVTGGIGGFVKSVIGGMLPSFNGGGWTGDGPRSGGLDGRGGMLAVVHPQEEVVDRHGQGRGRVGRDSDGMLVFGVADGVQARWIAQAEARSMSHLSNYADFQRQNFGSMLGEFQNRGTL